MHGHVKSYIVSYCLVLWFYVAILVTLSDLDCLFSDLNFPVKRSIKLALTYLQTVSYSQVISYIHLVTKFDANNNYYC